MWVCGRGAGYARRNDPVGEDRLVDEACQAADVLLFRRHHKLQLDQEGARLFVRFDRSVMDREENACHQRRQKTILAKMLVKGIIPYIYKHHVECPLPQPTVPSRSPGHPSPHACTHCLPGQNPNQHSTL